MAGTAGNTNGRRGNPWITRAWTSVSVLLLLTPLIAMQFTDEVNWTVSDFVFAGAMLLGAGVTYELAARVGNLAYQAGAVVALGAGVLTMWVTGAVGIIGAETNPGNLLYLGVVALAILGAILSGGRAARLVWAMGAAAFATSIVPVFAFNGVADPAHDALDFKVFLATGFFTALWALSAVLFHNAARGSRQ